MTIYFRVGGYFCVNFEGQINSLAVEAGGINKQDPHKADSNYLIDPNCVH